MSHLLHELSGSLSLNRVFFFPCLKLFGIGMLCFQRLASSYLDQCQIPGAWEIYFTPALWLRTRPHVSLLWSAFLHQPAAGSSASGEFSLFMLG